MLHLFSKEAVHCAVVSIPDNHRWQEKVNCYVSQHEGKEWPKRVAGGGGEKHGQWHERMQERYRKWQEWWEKECLKIEKREAERQ